MERIFSDRNFPIVAAKLARILVDWYGEEMLRECTKEVATSGRKKEKPTPGREAKPSQNLGTAATTDQLKRNGQWFTPADAAKLFPLVNGKPVHLRTVWRWMDSGKLKWEKLGGRRIISLQAIQEFCKASGREMQVGHVVRAAAARAKLWREVL
jgi:hypothetical protein